MALNVSAALAGASAAVLLALGSLGLGPRHMVEAGAVSLILFFSLMIQIVWRDDRKKQLSWAAPAGGSQKPRRQ